MIGVEQRMDIKELHQEGHSIKAISRLTGLSRNTVRKVLRGEHSLSYTKRSSSSKLDPFKAHIRKRFEACDLSAVRILEEIKAMGFDGSVSTVRRYLRELKPDKIRMDRVTVRFETPPGKQAQVDWMYCGSFDLPDGSKLKLYGFVMMLSFSRAKYVCFKTSMNFNTLIECHKEAFEYFGGWPETILYDNMKTVKLSRERWNPEFIDFCEHYGIVPKACRPYRARTKGKVERGIRYIRGNFLAGRVFDDLDDINRQVIGWLDHTAHQRIHATTKIKPAVLLEQEREHLTQLSAIAAYHVNRPVDRTVNYESMIQYRGNRYSVPPVYAGQTVKVKTEEGQIIVQSGDLIIAEHREAIKKGQCIVNKEHIAEIWKLTEQLTPTPQRDKNWDITFQQAVQNIDLARFEEVV